MNLIVELLGAPGVGKSTLIPRIQAQLRDLPLSQPPPPSRLDRAVGFGRFLAGHPRLVARSIAAIASWRQGSARDYAWVTRTWLKRCWRHLELREQPGLHIVDAGIAQALWSIGFRASHRVEVSQLRDFGIPDLLLVVDASDTVIERRLAGRPGSQSRLERDAKNSGHVRARALAMDVRDQLVARGVPARTLSNDGDEGIDDVAKAFSAEIRARWSG